MNPAFETDLSQPEFHPITPIRQRQIYSTHFYLLIFQENCNFIAIERNNIHTAKQEEVGPI
jgi:hypothetical protein